MAVDVRLGVLALDATGVAFGVGLAWNPLTRVGFAALATPVRLDFGGSPASPPFPNAAVLSLF